MEQKFNSGTKVTKWTYSRIRCVCGGVLVFEKTVRGGGIILEFPNIIWLDYSLIISLNSIGVLDISTLLYFHDILVAVSLKTVKTWNCGKFKNTLGFFAIVYDSQTIFKQSFFCWLKICLNFYKFITNLFTFREDLAFSLHPKQVLVQS